MIQNIDTHDRINPSVPTSSKPLKLKRTKIKYYDIFPERHDPVRGETAVWVAVITQALMDALSKSQNSEALHFKHEATTWLTSNSQNFIMVCTLAGFDPNYIRRKAKRALVSPKSWRAEAGKGNRYAERKAYRKRCREQGTQTPNDKSQGE